MSAFEHRGVVEGFYGTAYDEAERLSLIDEIGARGMNLYLHAPKDDPLQRERWRAPYPAEDLARFARWIEHAEAAGVRLGFALSPGLSIEYASEEDAALLCEKFVRFHDIGCRFFSLQLDDIPSLLQHPGDLERFESLAHAHVALAHRVIERLGESSTLWLVPTDYAGCGATPYLETIGERLDSVVEVAWTGRTVVSPTLEAGEATERARALRRRILLWDNYPVTDGPMRPMLHLGPYTGRGAGLAESLSGVLLNPMELPRASRPALFSACDFLCDPDHYDADRSFEGAIREVGRGAEEALLVFAGAHRTSPLAPSDRDRELEARFHAFRDADAAGRSSAHRELERAVARREAACETLRSDLSDRALLDELAPWLESFAAECHRMRIAVDFHAAMARAENAMDRFAAFSRFEGRLTHLATHPKASFGPRRVLYPQLDNHEDKTTAFGDDPALFVDRCLADEIVRHAEAVGANELGARRFTP